jgi:hypothetical protein
VTKSRYQGGVGFVACLIICSAVLSGCSSEGTALPSSRIELPSTWLEEKSDTPRASRSLSSDEVGMRLYPDGSAEVANLPVGREGNVDGYSCFIASGATYSGEATWSATDGGLLRLSHDNATLFWADSGRLGAVDWHELTLADCDKNNQSVYTGGYSAN